MAVSDAPLRGAAVLATATDNRRAYSTTSDAAGGFAFTVPPGRYAVTSEGCQSGTVTVRATRTTTQPLICPIP